MDKSYTGFYKDNQMDGFGVMKWTDGREYRGFWKEDKKHGYGIQTNLDGSSVSATFIDNKIFGFGIYTSASNSKKYGVWKQGKKVATLSDDQVQKMLWKEL